MITDQLIKTNIRVRIIAGSSFMLLSLYCLYSWVMAPHVNYVKAVQKYKPVAQGIQAEAEGIHRRIADSIQALSEIRDTYAKMHTTLFDSGQASYFLNHLESMASQQGCMVLTIYQVGSAPVTIGQDDEETSDDYENEDEYVEEEEEVETPSNLRSVDVIVSMNGPFQGIKAYVNELQTYTHKVFIRSLQMDARGDPRAGIRCRLELTLYVTMEREVN